MHQLGADTAQAAYSVLSKRASQLMLEAWQLDIDYSTDSVVVVEREGMRTTIEVTECWEIACLAARPPSGLGAPEANGHEERRAG